ncbi:MAG: gamma-glutamylcyclotransferase family protein [Candidatus Thiodiazotropha sp.]
MPLCTVVVEPGMFRYFGYGSNMNIVSLKAKGVVPLAAHRAVLHGWRLRFNVQHFFRHEGGVGNVEISALPGDQVLGVVYECPDDALASLDAMEACGHGYQRITIAVDAEGTQVDAFTYVGMPEFIDNQCLPSRRYLNILIEGARQAGLDPKYVNALISHPVHRSDVHPPFHVPPGDFPVFDARSLAQHPRYTALYGAVFDMSHARPLHDYLQGFFGGRDMTLFHLKRLDTSNGEESMDDIRQGRLTQAQLDYLNGYLKEYAREYRYVGRYNYNDNHSEE